MLNAKFLTLEDPAFSHLCIIRARMGSKTNPWVTRDILIVETLTMHLWTSLFLVK